MPLLPWKVLHCDDEANRDMLVLAQFHADEWTLSLRDERSGRLWTKRFAARIYEAGGEHTAAVTEVVLSCLYHGSTGPLCFSPANVNVAFDGPVCTIDARMTYTNEPNRGHSFVLTMDSPREAPSGHVHVWWGTSAEAAFPGRVLFWDLTTTPANVDGVRLENGSLVSLYPGDYAVTFQTVVHHPVAVALEDVDSASGQTLACVANWEDTTMSATRWVVRVTEFRARVCVRCKEGGFAMRGCTLSVRSLD